MATLAVHFIECKSLWSTSSGVCVPQSTVFLLLTCPQSKKYASSLDQTSLRRILLDLVLEPPAHHNTFCNVSLCELMLDTDCVWVQMKILDKDSLHWRTRKTKLSATSSGGPFPAQISNKKNLKLSKQWLITFNLDKNHIVLFSGINIKPSLSTYTLVTLLLQI